MHRPALLALLFAWLAATTHAADGKYTMKEATTPPPAELKEPVRGLLDGKSVQVLDPKGELYCEVWLRKSVPAKATEAQVNNGLTYQELPQTSLIGAIRFAQDAKDYRNQSVKAGVYTLRLAFQPQDGDHMGTAPHSEFCLLTAAEMDGKPDAIDVKALHDQSARSLGGSHPGVLLLFPHAKPESSPKLTDQGMDHWVLRQTLRVEANGKMVPLGIGLNVVGQSPSS